MHRLVGIQYLRAVAAIAVSVFHAALRFEYDFTGGSAGVDTFFVISGFLMVAITRPEANPLEFVKNRLKRIVPVYWIATTIVIVGALTVLFPNLTVEPQHAATSYLFIPFPDPRSGKLTPFLAPGWTLNYEMLFYIVFAGLLLLRRPTIVVAGLSSIFVGLAFLDKLISTDTVAERFYANDVILEFVLGAWVGLLWKSTDVWLRLPAKTIMIMSGTTLTAMVLLVPSVSPVIMFGLPAAGLVIGVLALERCQAVPKLYLAQLCGDASYSMYLWHGVAVSIAAMIVAHLGLPSSVGMALAIAGSVVGGIASYWILERPLIRWFHRRRAPSNLTAPARPSITSA